MDPSLLMPMVENENFSYLNHCQSSADPASTFRSISSRSTFNVSNMCLVQRNLFGPFHLDSVSITQCAVSDG